MKKTLRTVMEDYGLATKDGFEEEFSINCPFCHDTKQHLQVSEKKGLFYCYRRGCKGSLRFLLIKLGINFKVTPSEELPTSTLSEMSGLFSEIGTTPKAPTELLQDYSLEDHIPLYRSSSIFARRASQYLWYREISEEDIRDYNLRLGSGKYEGRVVIPFFEKGHCVYFQARTFLSQDPKVLSPSFDELPLGKSFWLFNYDQARNFDKVTVCEGWASAITAGKNAVAIQGKVASKVQLEKIASWSKVTVLLDSDAKAEAIELAEQLRFLRGGMVINIAFLEKGDPNDYSKEFIQEVINNAKVYTQLLGLELSLQEGL